MCRHLPVAIAGLLLAVTTHVPAEEPTAEQAEFFEKRVRPVLATHCQKCHGSKKQEASLRLDSRAGMLKGGDGGPAIVPGEPEQSELVDAIRYEPDGYQMPPTGKLKDDDIAALTEWIRMGAPWPGDRGEVDIADDGFDLEKRAEHWSFQPVERPAVPKNSGWARNPIDGFVHAKLSEAGLEPAAEADKRMLLRRVTFDLTGLPPTPDEIDAFLADESPDAYERVVDRLLASPRYGERWARHWMDLVRFAETAGHEFDYTIHHAWPYRDYAIRAFNEDVPYDGFVREHVAGDLLERPRRRVDNEANESIVGTAFWFFSQGKHSPVDIRAEECDRIDNQLDVFGKTFLGLTVACARCHDHKFDPITARDYYALAGVVESSRQHYAIVNPPHETAEPARRIQRVLRESQSALAAYTTDRLGTALAQLADPNAEPSPRLRELLATAEKEAGHPLHGLVEIRSTDDPAERENRRRAIWNPLVRKQESTAAAEADPNRPWVDFATFDDGTHEGWFVTGQAWGDRPTVAGDMRLQDDELQPVRELLPAGTAHSGALSPKLEGELRSRTFTIEKPTVWYRVARFGGKPSPGRANKNGQIHLIVDGFQFVKNPLYGQLTINLKNDGVFRWVRQDARKFIGKNAYIELLDEDDGYLVVDRIVFSDGGPPPESPNEFLLDIVGSEDAAKSPSQRYAGAIRSFLDRWAAGRLTNEPKDAGGVEVVNALLAAGLADEEPLDDPNAALGAMEARRTVAAEEANIRPAERALAVADGTGENVPLLVRGNHTKEGDDVPRRFLEIFHADPVGSPGSGRLEIARRMTNGENPLLARVMVNRLWHHHFGRGIVPTPDNFGVLGQAPSHPELLDWLAVEFQQRRWSVKSMTRMMVTSASYRQSSATANEAAEQRDSGNVLLHRANVRRLEGEAIRDAILALSGRIEQRMYGAGVLPHLTPFMEGRGRPGRSGPLDGDGRRSVYTNVRRNFLPPLFLAFDFPTPFTTTGRRSTSNVPAQALVLMNNPLVVQQAGVWSRRLAERAKDDDERIRLAYVSAFGREPTEVERGFAREFLAEQAVEYGGNTNDPRVWQDLCHALFNVKEFVYVR